MSNVLKGILTVHNVELPYDDPRKAAEAEKINASLKDSGFRTCRMAYDWAMAQYDHIPSNIWKKNPRAKISDRVISGLKSGDLVKVFKTVSDGDIFWQGKVNYSRKKYHHGFQKRMSERKWASMFVDEMPAKLEKGDKAIFGALQAFAETGTEGPIWSLQEYGKRDYDGLIMLDANDQLTVYSNVRDGAVEWEGRVDFGPEEPKKLKYFEVFRSTKHMDTEDWLQLSFERRPVIVARDIPVP